MADITPTAAAALQQANQASQRPTKAPDSPAAKANAPSGDTRSVKVDSRLLSRIEEESALKGVDVNIDADKARALALESQQQLAAQPLSIANQTPQGLQGLFR